MYSISEEMIEWSVKDSEDFDKKMKYKFGDDYYIIYAKIGEYLLKKKDRVRAYKNLNMAIFILEHKQDRTFVDEMNLVLLYEKSNKFDYAIRRIQKIIKNFTPSSEMYEIMSAILHRCKMKSFFQNSYNEYVEALRFFHMGKKCDNLYLKRKSEESIHELNKMILDMDLIKWK